MQTFRDRRDAGAQLARALHEHAESPEMVVLALPRGGVPVAYEIATRLALPLDVLVVRKLGVPGRAELAMGAIASGGAEVIDPRILQMLEISSEEFDAVARRERDELARCELVLRGDRPPLEVRGRTVVLVDDGLATGSTMLASVLAIRRRAPARLIVAVPVAAPHACATLRPRVDQLICLAIPSRLHAVGHWYDDFSQTTDAEVRELLDDARRALITDPQETWAPATPGGFVDPGPVPDKERHDHRR